MAQQPRTLIDKIWQEHRVGTRSDGRDLIYIDRHVLHDLHAAHAFASIEREKRGVRRPDLTVSVADHTLPTRMAGTGRTGSVFIDGMREGSLRYGIEMIDANDHRQGIVHVVSGELGIALPGLTLGCPDSHASTVGALGTLAFGCGTSELQHILATQVIAIAKPRNMRIMLNGRIRPGVSAKDLSLHLIRTIGSAAGRGYAIEYAGTSVTALDIDGRLALCNLTAEFGGRTSIIAPDEKTIAWCSGRPGAPPTAQWDAATAHWRTLTTDDGAVFDREVEIDCSGLDPQITWGTDPAQAMGVGDRVPSPNALDPKDRDAAERALAYMDLAPGESLAGKTIDRVFIGSCANGRLSDLRIAAGIIRGRTVAPGVTAIVVPGSSTIKRAAEEEGLDLIFKAAGFDWRQSGCSMCAGVNGDMGAPGERCVSTTNRNFENRQGAGVRTHLASPATAAASAVAGHIADARAFAEAR